MPVPRIEDIRQVSKRHGAGSRVWAEWCFLRVCFRHVRVRLLIMGLILLVGAVLVRALDDPGRDHSWVKATYLTFYLIFGEPQEGLPKSRVLQVMFFLVPILGLTIIIEGIVDFSLVLRDRRRFEKSWCVMLASSFQNHVVLVGLGRLGYRTFLTLRRLGEPVVVITRDENNEFLDQVRHDGSPLLLGDARQEALLEEANITKAKSIVVATSDDLANLEIALDARKLKPGIRVVLRMFDQNMADKVGDGFNIQMAMSQSAISAPTFATCAVAPATVNSVIVGDELVAMQRWLVRRDDPLAGRTVGDMMRTYGITVVEHCRPPDTRTVCPGPDVDCQAGDGLMVQGPVNVLESLRRERVAAPPDGSGE
jgi:Trk K+ transport system NAD-binding subunit